MRLLFICNEFPPTVHGGVGTFTLTLANHLMENGNDIHVMGFDQTVSQTVRSNEQGIQVTRLASPFRKRDYLQWGQYDIAIQILERMDLSRQARKYCQQNKIDLVESYDWSGPLWFHPGRPLMVRMHGAHFAHAFYEQRRSPRFITYVEKRNLSMANALVGVSQHIGELTLKAAGLRDRMFEVIYNGVDTSVFHPLKNVERTDREVLFAGTVARRKGIHELFAAIPLVLASVPSARFIIVGRLPVEQNSRNCLMEQLLTNLNPEERQSISFMDVRPYSEMPYWYNRAACAVFPSLAEAYGLTCVEAMACGAPVVMTSRASGPEIVEDGISGFLCEPTNQQALAETIVTLLANSALRKQISSKAVERVKENFEISSKLQDNTSVYEKLVANEYR
jgi:glycosyltransferase involved in cell wall biosynthesis